MAEKTKTVISKDNVVVNLYIPRDWLITIDQYAAINQQSRAAVLRLAMVKGIGTLADENAVRISDYMDELERYPDSYTPDK